MIDDKIRCTLSVTGSTHNKMNKINIQIQIWDTKNVEVEFGILRGA